MLYLPVVGSKVLVFELEDVKQLRLLGVVGVLSGTLPAAPQQNVFSGLPLQLSVEDVVWAVTTGHAVLVDAAAYHQAAPELVAQWNASHRVSIADDQHEAALMRKLGGLSEQQLALKRRQLALKRHKNFVVVPNTTPWALARHCEMPLAEFVARAGHSGLVRHYRAYRAMKERGFFLLPGIRFGGAFVGYPNDPLRYHAHYIVHPAPAVRLIDLVAAGRLATGVKKVWVVLRTEAPEAPEEEENADIVAELTRPVAPLCFSVEWAGFG